jgi:hypothetical protein
MLLIKLIRKYNNPLTLTYNNSGCPLISIGYYTDVQLAHVQAFSLL